MDNPNPELVAAAQIRKTMEIIQIELDRLERLVPGSVNDFQSLLNIVTEKDEEGIKNDPTEPNQTILTARAQAYNGLVQQRVRSADFSREYQRYHRLDDRGAPLPGGVPEWVHDPEVLGDSSDGSECS